MVALLLSNLFNLELMKSKLILSVEDSILFELELIKSVSVNICV